MSTEKANQGGARPGAGRPPKSDDHQKAIPLPASVYPWERDLIVEKYGSATKALKALAAELKLEKEKAPAA